MKKWIKTAALAGCFSASFPAMGMDAEEAAEKFGARPSILDVSISPEGDQIVLVAPSAEGGERAVVVDLNTSEAVPILGSKGGDEQINWCRFVLEERVVCQLYFREGDGRSVEAATRLAVISNDGSEMEMLSARTASLAYYSSNFGGAIIDFNAPDNPNAILITRWFEEVQQTGSLLGNDRTGLGVEEVDLLTLKRKTVETPRETAVGYYSDGRGSVRLMRTQPRDSRGFRQRDYGYFYRPVGAGWEELSRVAFDAGTSTGFEPVAVDSDENVAYGFDADGNYTALYKVALDGTYERSLVLSQPDADVDSLIRIGRDRRIVGASYATEKRLVRYFDPETKASVDSLAGALGGEKSIDIVDATDGEKKLLLLASSDTDPGMYYIFDKESRSLGQLLPARSDLSGVPMGKMTPVEYPAEDGAMIPGYLTLPPGSDGKGLPAIVMPHGGPSSRDEWGFDWLVQFFVHRGYAVLQPNYRGSSGLGSQWFQKNGFQSWETAISDVNSAGRWLESEGIAAPGKTAIFGWSYGGYAALQSQVVDPEAYRAVVVVAPVTDLDRLREESRGYADFEIVDNFIGNGPHVEAGSPARHAELFQAPVLMFHGTADVNVGVNESRYMEEQLKEAGKDVEYVEFDRLDHYLDNNEARKALLLRSDEFLREALGL